MSNGNGEHTTVCSLFEDPFIPPPISKDDLLKSQKELSVLQDRLMTSLALSDTVNFEDIAEIQETVNKLVMNGGSRVCQVQNVLVIWCLQ
jgi:hypothetical protein